MIAWKLYAVKPASKRNELLYCCDRDFRGQRSLDFCYPKSRQSPDTDNFHAIPYLLDRHRHGCFRPGNAIGFGPCILWLRLDGDKETGLGRRRCEGHSSGSSLDPSFRNPSNVFMADANRGGFTRGSTGKNRRDKRDRTLCGDHSSLLRGCYGL